MGNAVRFQLSLPECHASRSDVPAFRSILTFWRCVLVVCGVWGFFCSGACSGIPAWRSDIVFGCLGVGKLSISVLFNWVMSVVGQWHGQCSFLLCPHLADRLQLSLGSAFAGGLGFRLCRTSNLVLDRLGALQHVGALHLEVVACANRIVCANCVSLPIVLRVHMAGRLRIGSRFRIAVCLRIALRVRIVLLVPIVMRVSIALCVPIALRVPIVLRVPAVSRLPIALPIVICV